MEISPAQPSLICQAHSPPHIFCPSSSLPTSSYICKCFALLHRDLQILDLMWEALHRSPLIVRDCVLLLCITDLGNKYLLSLLHHSGMFDSLSYLVPKRRVRRPMNTDLMSFPNEAALTGSSFCSWQCSK